MCLEARDLQAMDLLQRTVGGAVCALLALNTLAGGGDTTNAVVQYGDERLIDSGPSLSDQRIEALLDSLCALDDAPRDLINDLRLFKRIRSMDETGITMLIDSLFGLEEVPFALVNEINLHVQLLPSQAEVDGAVPVDWSPYSCEPGWELYGAWNTTNPNAYGPAADPNDGIRLVRLTEDECGAEMPRCGVVTSRFGWRDGRAHNGVDIDLEVWDTVGTAFPGVVRYAGTHGGYGRLVVVRHFNGLETFYAHLHRIKVKSGDEVDAGQLVGLGGSSGHSTGSHLHFEVRFKGVPIDPGKVFDLEDGLLWSDALVLKRGRTGYAAYPMGTRFHTVEKGEHLYAIAQRYGAAIDDLCELNGITRRTRLRAGQQLLVAAD